MLSVIYAECHLCWVLSMLGVIYAECHLSWVSFMLSVIYAECRLCWVSFMLVSLFWVLWRPLMSLIYVIFLMILMFLPWHLRIGKQVLCHSANVSFLNCQSGITERGHINIIHELSNIMWNKHLQLVIISDNQMLLLHYNYNKFDTLAVSFNYFLCDFILFTF